jgi:hypothetical protein
MLQTAKKPGTVERSYQLLALLDVCEHAADCISDGLGPEHKARAAGNLAAVIKLAGELASEIRDDIELSERSSPADVI